MYFGSLEDCQILGKNPSGSSETLNKKTNSYYNIYACLTLQQQALT